MEKKSRRPLFCASHTCPKKVSIFRRFQQENASQILNGTKKVQKSASWGECQLGEVLVWGSASWGKCQLGDKIILLDGRFFSNLVDG